MGKYQNKYTTETAKEYVRQFDCDLISEYIGMNKTHTFKCKCGNYFTTTFAKFQNRNKRQCNSCGRKNSAIKQSLDINEIISVIEKYNCKLVSKDYINYKSNLLIECSCGNIFETTYANFLNSKHKCNKCSQEDANKSKRKYTYEYIRDICIENNCELVGNYDEYINRKDKIEIRCSCGDLFKTKLFMILDYNKFKCTPCNFKSAPKSLGELKIIEYLDNHNYKYKTQYKFDDCKNLYILRFDFAVFVEDKIKIIEFDGIQHFKSFDYYGGEKTFKNVVARDNIKNDYCENNNIPILRIKYNQINEIKNILDGFLNNMTISCQAS